MDALREALHELHDLDEYQVRRFDSGAPFEGSVAVLPSAFNPPTRAHFALLALARGTLGVRHGAALLTTRNVAKELTGAPLEHRVGMLLAAQEEPTLAVLTTNAARFVDQAAALRRAYPLVDFDFVAGFDTLIRILDPRYYNDMTGELTQFFAHHRLLGTNRAGRELDAAREVLARPEALPFAHRVVLAELDGASAAMSSTDVREGRGGHMVTPAVARYIQEHGLYH